jgi:transcriptional regulator with XRE-family HTH domain
MRQKTSTEPTWRRVRGSGGLGAALADARKARGLTQAQVAKALGVNRMTEVRMEAGENQTLERITKAFSLLGFDLVVVPRTARVHVELAPPAADASGIDGAMAPPQ